MRSRLMVEGKDAVMIYSLLSLKHVERIHLTNDASTASFQLKSIRYLSNACLNQLD